MSRSAKSILIFGIYMLVEGLLLFFIPNIFLEVVGIEPAQDVWIRAVGWAVFALGYYYIHAARTNFKAFFGWTVHIRSLQFVVFIAFVALSLANPRVLIFSGIEFLAGLWTLWEIRREARIKN